MLLHSLVVVTTFQILTNRPNQNTARKNEYYKSHLQRIATTGKGARRIYITFFCGSNRGIFPSFFMQCGLDFTVRCGSVRFCTAPHRTAPHRTAPHRTAPHRTAPHRTASDRTTPSRTAQAAKSHLRVPFPAPTHFPTGASLPFLFDHRRKRTQEGSSGLRPSSPPNIPLQAGNARRFQIRFLPRGAEMSLRQGYRRRPTNEHQRVPVLQGGGISGRGEFGGRVGYVETEELTGTIVNALARTWGQALSTPSQRAHSGIENKT